MIRSHRSSSGLRLVLLLPALLVAAGCATSQHVVFYPDAHLQKVGAAAAERDYQECLALARGAGVGEDKVAKAAKRGAKAGAVGAATGTAVGIVRGKRVLRSAGTGAAAGATGGFVSGLLADDPDPVTRRFVEKCLHERGYSTIGWR